MFFTMKFILINLVQTYMAVLGQDDGDDTHMENYDNKDYIMCGVTCLVRTPFPKIHAHFLAHADCSSRAVDLPRHRYYRYDF